MWEMISVPSKHMERLTKLLEEGWEPFAVTTNYQHTHDTIYLKRQAGGATVVQL